MAEHGKGSMSGNPYGQPSLKLFIGLFEDHLCLTLGNYLGICEASFVGN